MRTALATILIGLAFFAACNAEKPLLDKPPIDGLHYSDKDRREYYSSDEAPVKNGEQYRQPFKAK